MSNTGEPEGPNPNPKLDPIFQFLEAVTQRYQKDLQAPQEPPPGEISSQLDKALKHLERGPWAERVAAELPYGIAMAMGAWLVEGFADRFEAGPPSERAPERREPRSVLESLLAAEPLTLELSRSLVWMVTGEAPLLTKIGALRRYFARHFGMVVPGIRCRDNLELKTNQYRLVLDDVPLAEGYMESRNLLALGPEERLRELKLKPRRDPVYNLPCAWCKPDRKAELEGEGMVLVDAPSALMTHLTQLLRRHGYKLLGRQQVAYLLKLTERTHPALVREVRRRLTPAVVRKVLRNLLLEQVSIRRLPTVLEALLDEADHTQDADLLTSVARLALERQLTLEYEAPPGLLHALTLSAELSDRLRTELSGGRLLLDRELDETLKGALTTGVDSMLAEGYWPALALEPDLRVGFKRWSHPQHPDLVVVGLDELSPEVELRSAGLLGLTESDE